MFDAPVLSAAAPQADGRARVVVAVRAVVRARDAADPAQLGRGGVVDLTLRARLDPSTAAGAVLAAGDVLSVDWSETTAADVSVHTSDSGFSADATAAILDLLQNNAATVVPLGSLASIGTRAAVPATVALPAGGNAFVARPRPERHGWLDGADRWRAHRRLGDCSGRRVRAHARIRLSVGCAGCPAAAERHCVRGPAGWEDLRFADLTRVRGDGSPADPAAQARARAGDREDDGDRVARSGRLRPTRVRARRRLVGRRRAPGRRRRHYRGCSPERGCPAHRPRVTRRHLRRWPRWSRRRSRGRRFPPSGSRRSGCARFPGRPDRRARRDLRCDASRHLCRRGQRRDRDPRRRRWAGCWRAAGCGAFGAAIARHPSQLLLTAGASWAPGGELAGIAFAPGDGASIATTGDGTRLATTHAYSSAGGYTAMATATDGSAAASTSSLSVEVGTLRIGIVSATADQQERAGLADLRCIGPDDHVLCCRDRLGRASRRRRGLGLGWHLERSRTTDARGAATSSLRSIR